MTESEATRPILLHAISCAATLADTLSSWEMTGRATVLSRPLQAGDRVFHRTFGSGTVQSVDDRYARIVFDTAGLKTIAITEPYDRFILFVNGESDSLKRVVDRDLYYVAPVAHLASILDHGILCKRQVDERRLRRSDISDPDVQDLRERIRIRYEDKTRSLHDYANLYFCIRPPMLFVEKNRSRDDLIYIVVNSAVLSLPGALVSDGNMARQGLSKSQPSVVVTVEPAQKDNKRCKRTYDPPSYKPRQSAKMTNLFTVDVGLAAGNCKLDFAAIDGEDWRSDDERKRRKQAEALLPDCVPPPTFRGIVTRTEEILRQVKEICQAKRYTWLQCSMDPSWFYSDDHTWIRVF